MPLFRYFASRARKGIINRKTTGRNGKVIIITQQGKIIRVEASQIRETGRSAQGVPLLRAEEGDRIAAASLILQEEETDNGQKPLLQ